MTSMVKPHLFIPGPTNIPEAVRIAMNIPMEDMRSPEFPKFTLPIFEDLKKVFKMKPDVVREAVERALEKKKFVLAAKQSNELHLETEWLEDQGYRSRVEADIEPLSRSKTKLTLIMYLEQKPVFKDEWEPMDEIGEDTYKILMGDIEMECYRVLYDRT